MSTIPTFDTGNWTPDNIGSASAFDRATTQWLIANSLTNYLHAVDVANASAILDYEGRFAAYSRAVDARPDSLNTLTPPMPAYKQIIVVGANGFPAVGVSDSELVCPVKTYTPPSLTPGAKIQDIGGVKTGTAVLDPPATQTLYVPYKRSDGTVWVRTA